MKAIMERLGFFLLMSLLAMELSCSPTAAQTCSASASDISFGTVDVLSGASASTAGALNISCSGTANQTVRVCVNIAGTMIGGRRYMSASGSSSNFFYDVFQDAGLSALWGSYLQGGTGVQIDVALNPSGAGSASRSIYAEVYGSQQSVQVGSYTAPFTGNTANITFAYGTGFSCNVISTNETPMNFTASANVAANCNVTATTLDFGSVTSLNTEVAGTSSISVQCSAGAPYTVGLDGGLSQATDPTQRKLTSGAHTVLYGLYRDSAHQSPWGNSAGVSVASGNGTAAAQYFTIYGRVAPQAPPAVGTYNDTVVVAVSF